MHMHMASDPDPVVGVPGEEPPDPSDAAEAAAPEARPEGLTPRQQQVAALLNQLAAVGRGFLLYASRNDAVRRSLAALLQSFEGILGATPALRLEVRPFELEYEGRRVYLDRDRERSIALRLYRDGVRVLVFRRGFDGEQLARLLGILSLRYNGIHQQEDDVVSLLWKAGLRSLDVVAVEGLTPDDGALEDLATLSVGQPRPYLPEAEPPSLPLEQRTPEWLELEPEALDRLRREVASGTLPDHVLRLAHGLARGLVDESAQMRFAELASLFEELRDFLLSAENVAALLRFVRQLEAIAGAVPRWDPERAPRVRALLQSCGSHRAVRRLIHSVPDGQLVVPPAMQEALERVCADPFEAVGEALAVEDRPTARAIARQLLERYGGQRGEDVRQRFSRAQGRAAADFLRSLARLEGETAHGFIARQCTHPDHEVREEVLWQLERIAYTAAVGHAFVDAVRGTAGDQRSRVLMLVERSRDRRFVQPLFSLVQSLDEPGEASEVARVVGRLEGPAGLARWRPWLTPGGRFFVRRLPGSASQQAAAAAAVAEVPGEEASRLLRLALSAAGGDAQPWIERALASRGGRLEGARP
jgi:hypothetical protein